MTTFLPLAGAAVAVAVLWWLSRQLATRRLSRERMFTADPVEESAALPAALPAHEGEMSWLGWWLYRAGYRAPGAVEVFVLSTAALLALGVVLVVLFYCSGALRQLLYGLEEIPGGLGDIFLPFAYAGPWLVLAVLTALPTLMVRAARRQRVAQVEQDLPITLELLATLAEAGIGFDAALDRILESQPAGRPLAAELRLFQMEVLAGRPRTQCLRRLGRRLDVSALTLFVSALVQATQVGSGLSDVLRRQVEELRNRRREHALTVAAALPVKLLFPLIICFLPGIFVAALGPAFYQYFQLMDSLNRSRGAAVKTPWRLTRADTGALVVSSLEVADGVWSRFKGLQLRRGLAPGSGLLLVPCPSIHTFFMRFPIDVVLLDRQGCVVAVRRRVRPWRIVPPVRRSYGTLELPGGSSDLEVGVRLRLEGPGADAPTRSLAFLRPPQEAR